jgi:hypothetical protein
MSEDKPKLQTKRPPKKIPEAAVIEQDGGHIISQATINILVQEQNASPEQIIKLMEAELNYNRDRLMILRENSEKDPDNIESRKSKAFRRIQYYYLMVILPFLVYALYESSVTIAVSIATMIFFIIVSIAMNGRDRDNDSSMLIALLEKLMGNK